MAEDQIELDLASNEDTEVEVDSPEVEDSGVEVASTDQFEKADNATQKRIDRLTKKMREAERRENEAINYAKQVQQEAETLKQRFSNLDSSYVAEYSNRVQNEMSQAESEFARAMEMGDTQAAVEANKRMIALTSQSERAAQAKQAQERQQQAAPQAQQPMQHSNKSRRRLKGLIQKRRIGLKRMSGLVRMRPRLLRLLAFTKSLLRTKGLTRRAMTTILSLIEGFLTRLEVPRKHLADGPSRRLRVFLEITLGAVVGERFDSPRAKSQSRRNWVCR